MPGRFAVLVVLALVGSAVVARAQESGDDTAVAASSALRLPNLDRCVKGTTLRVALVPPGESAFASVTVRVGARDVLQLTGLTGPGSVVVALPRGSSRVTATATTDSGQFLEATRRYRRCSAATVAPRPTRPPRPTPQPPIDESEGSGES